MINCMLHTYGNAYTTFVQTTTLTLSNLWPLVSWYFGMSSKIFLTWCDKLHTPPLTRMIFARPHTDTWQSLTLGLAIFQTNCVTGWHPGWVVWTLRSPHHTQYSCFNLHSEGGARLHWHRQYLSLNAARWWLESLISTVCSLVLA